MARILIVEDCELQLMTIAEVLRGQQHSVQTARNGEEARTRLRSGTFELVITDIFMPDCDGLELIRDIRRGNRELPVLAITATGSHTELYLRIAEAFGASRVATKGQSATDYLSAVSELLEA